MSHILRLGCAKPSRNFRSAFSAMDKWRKLASLMCIEQSHQFVFHFNENLFIFRTHSLVSDITCNLCCRRHIIGVFEWFRLHAHMHNFVTVAALPLPLEAKINLNRYNFDMRNFIFRLNFRQNYFICVRRNSVVRLRGYRKSNSRTHQHQSVCTAKDVVAKLERNHWKPSPYRKLVYFRRHKQCQLPISCPHFQTKSANRDWKLRELSSIDIYAINSRACVWMTHTN